MSKYQNQYRSESTRLRDWDYSTPGAYFITICTEKMEYYFGDIADGKMVLSPVGTIADVMWYEIKNHWENIKLDKYIIMPNHIHGIIIIEDETNTVETGHAPSVNMALNWLKKTGRAPSLQARRASIPDIVGGYKSAVSKHAHRLGYAFAWQSRFWDHIIRNEKSYNEISEYIAMNPLKWDIDKLNKCNENEISATKNESIP